MTVQNGVPDLCQLRRDCCKWPAALKPVPVRASDARSLFRLNFNEAVEGGLRMGCFVLWLGRAGER